MILRLGVAFLAVEDLAAAAAPVRRWCGLLIGHPALLPATGNPIVSMLFGSSVVNKALYITFHPCSGLKQWLTWQQLRFEPPQSPQHG
jgi:hypothetical protein